MWGLLSATWVTILAYYILGKRWVNISRRDRVFETVHVNPYGLYTLNHLQVPSGGYAAAT